MLTAIKRYSFFFAAGLALCAAWSAPARAAKAPILELGFNDREIMAAFDKVLDDPFFEQFTGLTVYEKGGLSEPDRRVGGTQSFKFVKTCADTTVTETPKESKTYSGGYEITRRYTERTTRTETTAETLYLAYMPTVEFTKNPGKVKLYCEAGEFGKDPKAGKGTNPWAAFGGMLGGIGKSIALGAIGGRSWSGGGGCRWSPFNPADYSDWVGKLWLPWRLQQFLPGGEDKLDKAFTAFRKKKYDEALPLFEEFAKHFGYVKQAVPKNEPERKVWPYVYSCRMPELFAILGDIYRLHSKDMEKAEENYRIAYSVGGSPYLAETAGIARANRGLGYTLYARAARAKDGPDKELFEKLGERTAFHLYAYLGFYKDKDAPDKPEVLRMIDEVDPDEIEQREKEAERKVKAAESVKENKEQREKVKAIMEY